MKGLLAGLMLLVSTSAQADELLAQATLLIVADWSQTREIARSPYYAESNPLLGPRPSTGDVDKYFGAALIGTWVLSEILPTRERRIFLTSVTVVQGAFVQHNALLGVGFDF